MTLFYRNALEGGQPYLEALRNAQLEILQQLRGDDAGPSEEFRGAGRGDHVHLHRRRVKKFRK